MNVLDRKPAVGRGYSHALGAVGQLFGFVEYEDILPEVGRHHSSDHHTGLVVDDR